MWNIISRYVHIFPYLRGKNIAWNVLITMWIFSCRSSLWLTRIEMAGLSEANGFLGGFPSQQAVELYKMMALNAMQSPPLPTLQDLQTLQSNMFSLPGCSQPLLPQGFGQMSPLGAYSHLSPYSHLGIHANLCGQYAFQLGLNMNQLSQTMFEDDQQDIEDDPKVELVERDLWEKFHRLGTEMVSKARMSNYYWNFCIIIIFKFQVFQ